MGTAQIAGPKSTTQALDASVYRSKHLRLVIQGWLHEQARLEPGSVEICPSVGKIEMDSVSLRCFINPVKVADTLRLNQGTYRPPPHARRTTPRVSALLL
jgi:hypothetical protein